MKGGRNFQKSRTLDLLDFLLDESFAKPDTSKRLREGLKLKLDCYFKIKILFYRRHSRESLTRFV